MPRAVITEDQPLLSGELRQARVARWPELGVCAEAPDEGAALRALEQFAPDALFLDIEMPGMTGLEVAKLAGGRCHVVFVTAYDRCAVAAPEEQAVDCLLKPLALPRLVSTVTRLKERLPCRPPPSSIRWRSVATSRPPAACAGSPRQRGRTYAS